MSDPYIVPATIIGPDSVRALHAAGYRIVPVKPSRMMINAAAEELKRIKLERGVQWLNMCQREKASIRYAAMLNAWIVDRGGLREPMSKRDRRDRRTVLHRRLRTAKHHIYVRPKLWLAGVFGVGK